MLTASADTFVGTEKGDVFNAYEFVSAAGSQLATLNSIDSLDGGEGKDTLNVKSNIAIAAASATIKNIETINLESGSTIGAGAAFDTTTFTGVETLNVTKATNTAGLAADLTAAATTDVNVSGVTTGGIVVKGGKNVDIKATGSSVTSTKAAGTVTVTDAGKATVATNIVVENGTDVTVNATTDTTGTIKVGDTAGKVAAKAATGDVEVNSTFTTVAATDDVANAISVDGGKTITVNQMVTSSDTVLANTTGQTITQGDVTITGQDTTTTVTVKQEKSTAENAAVVAVAEKLSTSTVTFKGMVKGDSVTVNGLTFTASKALTAAEVAAAFANLEIGDTQVNSGPTANGIFTGANDTAAIWTSGAVTNVDATTSTVTYSAKVAGKPTDLVVAKTGAAPIPVATVATTGVIAVDAEAGVTGIINGKVTIADGGIDSIKTISVDGYGDSTINANLLETLTLANSGGATAGATNATMTVTTASTGSLTLNLDNVNGNVSLDGGSATLTGLNITTTGKDSKFALTAAKVETLTINATADLDISAAGTNLSALKTVDVNGAGAVNLGVISTATALNSFDASGNTGGVTAKIETLTANVGTITEYVFSAGNDDVTLADATVNTKITLGAGDDKITLDSGTTALAAMIDGGAGTDTLHMDSADAKTASAGTTFEANISNFEKLSLGFSSATETVDLDNMDDISYVVSANSGVAAAGAEVFTVDFTTSGTITGADTITFDGITTTLVGGENATAIATAVAGQTYANWDGVDNGDGTVTFTANTAGARVDTTTSNFTIVDTDATTAVATHSIDTEGTVTYTFNTTNLLLNAPAGNEDTFVIGDYMYTAGADGDGLTQIAADINKGGAGTTINGILYTATASGANLVLTTSNATPLASLTYTANDVGTNGGTFNAGTDSGSAQNKANGATEQFTVDFTPSGAIEDGDTIVFDGTTVTLTTGMTPAQIAIAIAGQAYTNYTASNIGGNKVQFTAKTAGTVNTALSDFTITNNSSTNPELVAIVTTDTQGTDAGTTPTLTLDNMANNGTLELTDAGAGVTVIMKDASGKTDTFNIVTGDEAGDVGTVNVNGVETINVTTTDIFTDDGLIAGIADDGKDDSNSSSTLAVSADAAKTVNVSGAGDLVLDMAGNTAVTLIDGSKMTGNLTVTAYNSDMTVKGGAGDDTLSVYGTGTISVSGVVLTGGNGTDTFDVSAFNSLGNAGSAVTITDLTAGETIVFKGSTGAEKFVSSKVTLIAESTFAQYVSKAAEIANTASSSTEANIAWFQFNNNTFVVQDVDSLGAFNNGDIIVKINGLVDLSTASYNATSNTLEIA